MKASLGIYRQIGDRGSEACTLNRYATVIGATSGHADALDLYRHALRLASETETRDSEAVALEGIGECYLHLGDTRAGISYLRQAEEMFQRLAMTPDTERVQGLLAQLAEV